MRSCRHRSGAATGPPAEPPAPERGTWGDHPPLPDRHHRRGRAELREGGSLRGALASWRTIPATRWRERWHGSAALSMARKTCIFSGLPV